MNFSSILVPLDGSSFAEAAIPLASGLARRAQARIRLALVHHSFPGAGLEDEGAAIDPLVRAGEVSYLAATAERLGGVSSLPVETVPLDGDPGTALAREASRGQDDMVVMATHGRGAFSRMVLGSVADYLVRHLTVPVLLVRPSQDQSAPESVEFEHVLVPLDASEVSEAILEPVIALLGLKKTPRSRVTLLSVVEPVLGAGEPGLAVAIPLNPELLEEQRRIAEHRLAGVQERLRAKALRVEARVITETRPAEAILEAAERERVDLIAMTTHGEGGLRRLLLGSVAYKVVRGSHVPVLVLRPTGY